MKCDTSGPFIKSTECSLRTTNDSWILCRYLQLPNRQQAGRLMYTVHTYSHMYACMCLDRFVLIVFPVHLVTKTCQAFYSLQNKPRREIFLTKLVHWDSMVSTDYSSSISIYFRAYPKLSIVTCNRTICYWFQADIDFLTIDRYKDRHKY